MVSTTTYRRGTVGRGRRQPSLRIFLICVGVWLLSLCLATYTRDRAAGPPQRAVLPPGLLASELLDVEKHASRKPALNDQTHDTIRASPRWSVPDTSPARHRAPHVEIRGRGGTAHFVPSYRLQPCDRCVHFSSTCRPFAVHSTSTGHTETTPNRTLTPLHPSNGAEVDPHNGDG
jgi:hypothetical protein